MSEDILPLRAGAAAGQRVSDSDRDQLAEELRAHAVAGRLSTDELEQRLQTAYQARTVGDLDGLRHDLPATPESLALDQRARRTRLVRHSIQETGGSLGAFVVCTVIWAATGAGFFWPLFVIIPFLLAATRSGWDLFGPGADLDAAEARLGARADERRGHRDGRRGHRDGRRDRGRARH
jgi:hypothetical protein